MLVATCVKPKAVQYQKLIRHICVWMSRLLSNLGNKENAIDACGRHMWQIILVKVCKNLLGYTTSKCICIFKGIKYVGICM